MKRTSKVLDDLIANIMYDGELGYFDPSKFQIDYVAPMKKNRRDLQVIFDKNATTVIFDENTKVTVKAHCETIDHEKGFAMALAKYIFADENGYWKNRFVRYISEAENAELKRIVNAGMKDLKREYISSYQSNFVKAISKYIKNDDGKLTYSDAVSQANGLLPFEVISDCVDSALSKAYQSVMRKYKKYIPAETGLESDDVVDAFKTAIQKYHEVMGHQMLSEFKGSQK